MDSVAPICIGVVIPTLNSGETLRYTLDSLSKQKNIDVDILVADSGSTDGTLTICDDFGVRVIYVAKGNIYRAVNAGLRQLMRDWVTYLNSDDIVDATAYATLTKYGINGNVDLVYGDCEYINKENEYIGRRHSAFRPLLGGLLKGRIMPFAQPSCVFRKTLYDRLEGFDERFQLDADLDFFGRAYVGGAKFHRVARTVSSFRVHPAQLSNVYRDRANAELAQLHYPGELRSKIPRIVALLLWRLQNAIPLLEKIVRIARSRLE